MTGTLAPPSSGPRHAFVGPVTLLMGAAIALGALLEASLIALSLLGLMFILALAPWVQQAHRGHMQPFHPLLYASIVTATPSFLKASWLLLSNRRDGVLGLTSNPDAFFVLSLAYTVLGLSAYFFGFLIPIGTALGSRLPTFHPFRHASPRRFGMTLFTAGALVTVFLANAGAFGYVVYSGDPLILNILQRLGDVRYMGLFLLFAAIEYRHPRVGTPRGLSFALLALLPQLILDVSSGGRVAVLITLLVATAGYYYSSRGRITVRRQFQLAALAVLVLSLGILVGSEYRARRSLLGPVESPYTLADSTSLAQQSLTSALTGSSGASLAVLGDVLFRRLGTIDSLALVLDRHDVLRSAEEQLGMSNNITRDLTVGLVPRIVWPNKPTISGFGRDFYHLYFGGTGTSSEGPTGIGDLFRNFGIVGIVAGMAIVGVWHRALYSWLFHPNAPPTTAMVFVVAILRHGFESTYATFYLAPIQILALTFVLSTLYALARQTRPRPSGVQ